MEQTPHQEGELQATPPRRLSPYEEQHEQHQESPDEQVIRQGIERALRDGTEIDNRTARYIASQLHEGQTSALYSLASTGAIAEEIHNELTRDFDQQSNQVQWWINWLGTYCLNREDTGPVAGWMETAAAIDWAEAVAHEQSEAYEDEAQARQDLMQRISAAGVTTLGSVATVMTVADAASSATGGSAHAGIPGGVYDEQPGHHNEPDEAGEPDTFPWADAARWSPDNHDDELARDRLDELFGEIPDEEIGTVEDIGWFGLLRHEAQPGGVVLSQNGYGFRHVWETNSDEQLGRHWRELQREYDSFTEATRAHNREPGDRDDERERAETVSGHHPEIWVGSLSDYNNGRLHGVWLDATLDHDELRDAIAFMLRNGYDTNAEEWSIFDYDDFCGLDLGEYESLDVVSRVAGGIAEHGEAFAQWVEYVGERTEEALGRFEDHYLGKFESTEAYVANLLEECDGYSFEEFVPEWLKPYVKIDVELLARDTEIELYVVESGEGGVVVFDTRG